MAQRNTLPVLTKYERAAILAADALRLANGEPCTIRNPGTSNPVELSRMEFREQKIPLKIRRKMPDGSVEVWGLNELINPYDVGTGHTAP